MNWKQYLQESKRTASTDSEINLSKRDFNLLHASMGLSTEANEIVDILKKRIFYGKPIDEVNFQEEIGDLFWYIALACRELNLDFENILDINIKKLKARFPDKFTKDKALNRDLKTEREILEETRIKKDRNKC